MRVAIGCDQGGFGLKDDVVAVVTALGHELLDLGIYELQSVDYPDYARAVAQAVVGGEADLGILICGTGIGVSIAANKVRGAYAAHVCDCYSARMAREHNGANVLCLGGRILGPEIAREIVRVFLTTEPSPEDRHARRRDGIRGLEEQ